MNDPSPYQSFFDGPPSRETAARLFRIVKVMAAPLLGALFGGAGGGVGLSMCVIGFEEHGGGPGYDLLLALMSFPVGFLYCLPVGFTTGVLLIPILCLVRSHSVVASAVVGFCVAVIAFYWFDYLERSPNWEPALRYLGPRICAAGFAALGLTWLLGARKQSATVQDA